MRSRSATAMRLASVPLSVSAELPTDQVCRLGDDQTGGQQRLRFAFQQRSAGLVVGAAAVGHSQQRASATSSTQSRRYPWASSPSACAAPPADPDAPILAKDSRRRCPAASHGASSPASSPGSCTVTLTNPG